MTKPLSSSNCHGNIYRWLKMIKFNQSDLLIDFVSFNLWFFIQLCWIIRKLYMKIILLCPFLKLLLLLRTLSTVFFVLSHLSHYFTRNFPQLTFLISPKVKIKFSSYFNCFIADVNANVLKQMVCTSKYKKMYMCLLYFTIYIIYK